MSIYISRYGCMYHKRNNNNNNNNKKDEVAHVL